ncbi:hypothetical protein RND71_031405 [Anisodus tanguticus]|uniref:Uncharacterized protein n=1 Tax=Anisodus tanguticus TaxID=243964 RepID=A0AAE1RAP2_9SOLA|nr:hypothetical protein RND71_031405 [Anisodus tanguticus]
MTTFNDINNKWFGVRPEIRIGTEIVYVNCFVESNVRAPFEVIYEAYEGEEEDDEILNKDSDIHAKTMD